MEMSEIEKFLHDQIKENITNTTSLLEQELKSSACLLKWFDYNENFKELQNLIKKKKEAERGSLHCLYYLKNVTAEWLKLLKRHHHSNQKIPCTVHELRQRVKTALLEVKRLSSQEDVSQSSPEPECSPKSYSWSSPTEVPKKTYGIDDRVKIMERLLDKKDSFNAIGIAGMAGVGKTTLCQVAFNNPQVKEKFFPRIWVCLSKQPKDPGNVEDFPEEAVKRMLMCLGFGFDIINNKAGVECDLHTLLMALRQQLMGKRYLIVLDDVRNFTGNVKNFFTSLTDDVSEHNHDELEHLAHGLPKGHGGTVIVSSRYGNMAKTMVGEKNLLGLLPLADKQSCWEICKDEVPEDHPLLQHEEKVREKVKEMIQSKCDGLPLLAKILGKITANQPTAPKENPPNKTKTEIQEDMGEK